MTNKITHTVLLQICVAAAVVSLRPGSAFAAPSDEANSDLEVSAAATSAAPASSGTPQASVNAAATPAPPETGTPSVAPNAPPLPVPVSPNLNGQASAPNAPVASTPAPAAASVAAPAPVQIASAAQVEPESTPKSASEIPPLKSSEPSLAQQLTEGYRISGYLQAQYEAHQDSEDQLNQSNGLLNQNRFLIRRGRVALSRDWEFASLNLEFDGNTSKGPAFRWQRAEGSLVYGRSKEQGVQPLVQFSMGMFNLPFGFEMTESAKTRAFMERSLGGRALFPSEPDVGARLSGQVKFLRYSVATTNGEPLDEKSGFGLQDPNKNKDVTVRLGVVTKPWPKFVASGDISYNAGKGLHPGTPATKTSTGWSDANHDGRVTIEELDPKPATAATPSMNFSRWALGADAQFSYASPLGKSTLYGEIVVAQNLDRGLFISDPLATIGGQNIRQLSYYVAFVQELTPYALAGFRTDFYDPDSDFFDTRGGKQVPASQAIRNYSPLVGLVLPDRAKLLFQWDIQSNLLGRDTSGVPARRPNNIMTLRMQVNL